MNPLQAISADLLLESAASRAMVRLVGGNGQLSIAGESVRSGAGQVRNGVAKTPPGDTALVREAQQEKRVVSQEGGRVGSEAAGAQIVAPVIVDDRVAAILSIDGGADQKAWDKKDREAIDKAQKRTAEAITAISKRRLNATGEDLRDTAIQAILDRLRTTLDVQRCTFRQNVLAAFAFPVTHESRAEGVRSLYGDFTIVQSGQPVIEKLLNERSQVIQEDCRVASTAPEFHVMLKHYGDMRAQIVTPFIQGSNLIGVLSIHELRSTRAWKKDEMTLGADATKLLGQLALADLT